MRTILYVETGTGFGGSAQNLLARLQGLDRARFRPVVVAYHDGPSMQRIRALGVAVHLLGPVVPKVGGYAWMVRNWLRHELPRTARLVRLIRRERIDAVHTNNDLYSSVAPIWAARLTGRPLICHLQLTRIPTRLEQHLGGWADRLVAVTQHAGALYRRTWPAQRLAVIYDAVSEDGVGVNGAASLRQKLGLPPAAPVVGLLARCVPGKGYEEFLRAAALVQQRQPAVRYLIVGNGPGGDVVHEAAMRQLAGELDLAAVVTWAGWRNDTARVVHMLNIVVQASSTFPEGLSRVLLEAQAAGRPVVATELATTREAVVDGETGLLVPPGNPQALAEAILRVVGDAPLARRLGAQARARMAAHFSVRAHGEQVMRLYDEVLSTSSFGGRLRSPFRWALVGHVTSRTTSPNYDTGHVTDNRHTTSQEPHGP